MGAEEQLFAITPLDGRYASKVDELAHVVSEFGLIQRRVAVETAWLTTLADGTLPDVPPLSDAALDELVRIPRMFNEKDAAAVKKIEKTTNHDVKAVEVWLRDTLAGKDGAFDDHLELIHFGCTSEDINNLAYALMLREARDQELLANAETVVDELDLRATDFADVPMLAHTHGQPATPTTVGKEMRVFADRLAAHAQRFGAIAILGKFNGASGNYNAATFAYPEVDWPIVAKKFVEGLGLEFNPTTTQIEPHDWTAAYSNELALGNTIQIDLARDMWTYISKGYFKQVVNKEETGSSTMPHKVNPIDFENAEANFGLANALLVHLAGKLPISRMQRDLSDSSAQRAFGEAFGHTVVAQKSLLRGLGKATPNPERIDDELSGEWSILTEAIQTVMRRHRVPGAYEQIKDATRGKPLDEAGYLRLVAKLDLPAEARDRLLDLTPQTYLGRAEDIARGKA